MSQDVQCSPAKITGVTDTQVVARIGTKRIILFCDDAVRSEMQEIIPRKVQITYTEDKLISYEDIEK